MITVPRARTRVPTLDLGAMSSQLAEELDAAWHSVVASSAFVAGPEVDIFEQDWAAYCERRHAVGVANGTEAIELVLRALGIGRGDEVIVPTNTFVATVEAVMLRRSDPQARRCRSPDARAPSRRRRRRDHGRTAAVIAVHFTGTCPTWTSSRRSRGDGASR